MEEKLALLRKRYGNFKNMNTIGVECLANEVRKLVDDGQNQVPVPIATLIDKLGFRIYAEKFTDTELLAIIGHHKGFLEKYYYDKILKLQEGLPKTMLRQALAMEIAHYIMNYQEDDEYVHGCNREAQMDPVLLGFASALLLPSNSFVADYRQFMSKTEDKGLTRQLLKNKYEVTEELVLLRALNLGLDLSIRE